MAVEENEGYPSVRPEDIEALAACEPLMRQAGCYVAPAIPNAVLGGALRSYLEIEPGEWILAVIDRSGGTSSHEGCTLTSRRICWPSRVGRNDPGPATLEEASPGPRSKWRPTSVRYQDLPATIARTGKANPRLELGEGVDLTLRDLHPPAADALVTTLERIQRGATGGPIPEYTPETGRWVREALAQVVRGAQAIRGVVEEFRAFHEQARAATPRVVVGRMLFGACVLVYLAMIAVGGQGIDPDAETLYRWGGNFGMTVAVEGEWWRLFSCMFLHAGPFHLLVNMIFLWRAGPLIERLYGNVGFALLFIGSGVGGSLASAWSHPMVVGVGASGAIFGILGGLLAFLTLHRSAIPAVVLKPIRSSVISLVVFNGLFGFIYPRVDNAAHLGGLTSGFLAGLILRRPWPIDRPNVGLARQVGGGALIAAILTAASIGVEARIRRAPEVAYVELRRVLEPALGRFQSVHARLGDRLGGVAKDPPALDALIAEVDADLGQLRAVEDSGPDLAPLVEALVEADAELLEALQALRRFLDDPDDRDLLDGPEGFVPHQKRGLRAADRFARLDRAFARAHDMQAIGAEAGD